MEEQTVLQLPANAGDKARRFVDAAWPCDPSTKSPDEVLFSITNAGLKVKV